jgi:thiol-disulfide isomerase/thioredoxin
VINRDTPEFAKASACLFAKYPMQSVETTVLKALFDAHLLAPSAVQVKALEPALEALYDECVLDFLNTFEKPCEEIAALDQNQIGDRFQRLLVNRKDDLRHWVVANVYSRPIYDMRAYYDSGLSAAIFHEYEEALADAGVPLGDMNTRLGVLNYITRMVSDLVEEYAKSEFSPPNMPSASHPDVLLYLKNLATFPKLRDQEFKKSAAAQKAYTQLFSKIRDARNSAIQKATHQRNLAIGALAVCVVTGVAMMWRSRSKPKIRQVRKQAVFTPKQEEYANRDWARTDYPQLITPPAPIPYEDITDES